MGAHFENNQKYINTVALLSTSFEKNSTRNILYRRNAIYFYQNSLGFYKQHYNNFKNKDLKTKQYIQIALVERKLLKKLSFVVVTFQRISQSSAIEDSHNRLAQKSKLKAARWMTLQAFF